MGDVAGGDRARGARLRLARRRPRAAARRSAATATGGGVIQDAASTANFVATVAAREAATGGDVAAHRRRSAPTRRVDAHSSVEKGCASPGSAADQLRLVDVDAERRLRVDALAAAIERDARRRAPAVPRRGDRRHHLVPRRRPRRRPPATSPAAAGLGPRRRRHGRVSAGAVPELRPLVTAGLDRVDSYCFDPHKWLLAGMDCDVLYVADRAALTSAMSVVPEYLRNTATESGEVIDYRDWGVALGRRFRSLKLWWVLRAYGADGPRRHGPAPLRPRRRTWPSGSTAHPDLELVVPVPAAARVHRPPRRRRRHAAPARRRQRQRRLRHAHAARRPSRRSGCRSPQAPRSSSATSTRCGPPSRPPRDAARRRPPRRPCRRSGRRRRLRRSDVA